jgi:hypothetical protein
MNQTVRIALGMLAASLMAMVAGAAEISTDSFDVVLPAAFAAPAKTNTTQAGIDITTWVSKAPTGEAVVISVSKMPAKIADPAKVMDGTRDSLLKSVKGVLESEEALPGDMPARRLLFRSGTAFLRSRLVVKDDRLVQLLYVGRSEQQRAVPEVGRMFDSFRVLGPPMTASAAQPKPVTTPH